MENISLLLNEALTPYQVSLEEHDSHGNCHVVISTQSGATVLQRQVNKHQFEDLRSFTDVVDGLHRDILVAEGRLEPCMLAALRSASQNAAFSTSRI